MKNERIYKMSLADIYPALVNKAIRKGRSQQEVNQIIEWLTGYDENSLNDLVASDISYQDFFEKAPTLNPNRKKITGVICGVRVENIEEPLMQEIRYLDKLVDELAKGKKMEKILRG